MTQSVRYDLAGVGSMVVDAIHRVSRFADRDEKVLLESHPDGLPIRRLVGGVILNQLGWAAILGLRVAVFGKQADDPEGRFLRQGMRRVSIEPHLDLSGRASSLAQVYVDREGARAIYMARGATGEVTPQDVDSLYRPVIEASATVSTEVSQLPLAVACRVLEIARGVGARTVVDLDVPLDDAVPALGTREELDALLLRADILKPSLAATRGIVDAHDPRDAAREMADRYGAEAVVITTGPEGCVVRADSKTLVSPACKVAVLDTTGAGDAFLGGFLAGLHYGLGWEDAARLGNACGAHCCEKVGAFPDAALDSRARVRELYASLGGTPLEPADPRVGSEEDEDALERFLSVAAREVGAVAEGIDRSGLGAAAARIRRAEARGGRLHVTGVGKSAHVARYAAALMASTGTPSTFLDPGEATHGSVGQLREGDVLIAVSNSGETTELLACVEATRGLGADVIAVCGRRTSPLSARAGLTLHCGVAEEGGPLGLAPRASFLAQAVVLQGLSVLLQQGRRLSVAEYHERHPAGALGRRAAESGGEPS